MELIPFEYVNYKMIVLGKLEDYWCVTFFVNDLFIHLFNLYEWNLSYPDADPVS